MWHALSQISRYTWTAPSARQPLFGGLAVEEQFYLIWFFLLIATSKQRVLGLILSGIIVAPIFRFAMLTAGNEWSAVLLPGAIDYFCLGAVIAYAECLRPNLDVMFRTRFANIAFVVLMSTLMLATLALPNGDLRTTTNGLVKGFYRSALL